MNREEERIEAMSEILNDLGIKIEYSDIKKIIKDFSYHLMMEKEMGSYQHIKHKEACLQCKSLEEKISQVTKERDIYHKSVCARRGTDDVYIEGDRVMYRP